MDEQKSISEVEAQKMTNCRAGLSEAEAGKRLQTYGKNIFKKERKISKIELFLKQLNEPLIYVLLAAAVISFLLKEISDTIIIVVVVLVNALVGIIQEGKARKALEALEKLTTPTALVKRGGIVKEINANYLVPGDIVCLEAGRQIPADLRLIFTESLKIEEASLTGESLSVEKDARFQAKKEVPMGDRKNMAYMSTSVILGRGEGIVTATGMETEIGKIAGMIAETEQEATPLQKRLGDLGGMLSILAVLLCVALFFVAVIQKRNVMDMLITAISLAVAAVPEGLPAVVTIVLALSVSRMVKVHTIVRRLPSVETLGAVNIVCTDKTGTLTQNKMTVTKCYTNSRFFAPGELGASQYSEFTEGFMLCNDAVINGKNRIGDPTELSLLDLGTQIGVKKEMLERKIPRTGELPFDSKRKMMTTFHRKNGIKIAYTKGSCDELLKHCTHIWLNQKSIPLDTYRKREIEQVMKTMAGDALRVLALGMQIAPKDQKEENMIFIGLVGMIDPERPEAAHAIGIFRKACVKTVMITGDHIDTAFAIGKKLGIVTKRDECITGMELSNMTEEKLIANIEGYRVFARVSPEHKVRIVKAYQSLDNIVAMTGDGVNDAPSLKSADIGIAMGMNGTDVAKNAADIILTDDNFATIEKAIEEGRGIYENIKKSVLFLLSSNFGEIITMFVSILAGLASPLKASHILWINLITDSLPALALGVDENNPKLLMQKPPRKAKDSLFAGGGLSCTLFYGTLIAAISLVAFLTIPYRYLYENQLQFTLHNINQVLGFSDVLARSQTYSFTVLGISELFHAIGMRNREVSIFKTGLFSNKLMLAAFGVGILLQVAVTEIPYFITMFGTVRLSVNEWMQLIFLSAMPLLAHEILAFRPKHIAVGKKGYKEEKAITIQP